ncbi:TonB-dependent receptor [Pseudomonas sp. LP_7_YM]|uniref:TonB-dependent siderophore receptor n=1 Tax=Pseudomonas sp. LP_7_YM TaxID=2485137 RepID=UPI00105BA563|nr:TonB-dependent receptor [Pseudomonas sp. LP_7_YM]TDV72293.1 outer membrane receptor for ferric coprogen and ferric-rhodotorulic acid [Pseudomonas sp. LP_7_YM]
MARQQQRATPCDSRWQRSALSATLACTLLIGTVQAYGASSPVAPTAAQKLSLNIPAQQLRQALLMFSQQSGQNVLLDGNLDAALRSNTVVGNYSAEDALARLLQGSGYSFARTDAATFYLVPVAANARGAPVNLAATQIQYHSLSDDAPGQTYRGKPASSTTRLGLSNRETPQAITTVTRQQIDDFKLNSVKEALRSAPSVTVEQFETDRTAFTSRGFNIDNFEYDGMGMPFSSGVLLGDQDLAEFEQIDVLHGANGLMSGTGNPSATVNFVRKRPTDTFQAKIDSSIGSWDKRRVELDVSGPLTDSGNVRGRFIYAHDKGNAYLDRYSHELNLASGLLAFDLSDADTLTVGFSEQRNDSNGSTWGALPIADYNGNRIHYSSRSSSIGQPWTYWNIHTQRAFAELAHDLGNGWSGKITLTGVNQHQDTQMLYAIPATADDVFAYMNRTTSVEHEMTGEAQLSGPFQLFGREHEITVGANYGRSRHTERGHYKDASGYQLVSLADALAGTVPQPAFDYTDSLNTQLLTDRQKSVFAGARFSLTDDLHWIAGARMLSADGKGLGYGSPHDTREHGKVTPYTGLVYDLNSQWSLYGSWTEIFKPQYFRSTAGGVIEPLQGKSMEVGIKGGLLDERLTMTAALFKTEQQNVAEATGQIVGGQYVYQGMNYKSHGMELEASGQALPGLEMGAGYTYVKIEDDNGDKARQYVPTHSLRGSATYRLPGLPKARIGTRVQWQSGTQRDTNSQVRQNAYALVDLMTRYEIDEHWSTSLNLNNVTDRKYLLSLYQAAGSTNYGAPRNLMASVSWTY